MSENEFSLAVSRLKDDRAGGVQRSMIAAEGVNPDRHARVLELSRKHKVPVDTVDQNFEEFEAYDRRNAFKPEKLVVSAPGLTEWLSDPNNSAVAQNDVGALAKIEESINDFVRSSEALSAFSSGTAKFMENVAKVPALAYDLAALPQNLVAKYADMPELRAQSPEWLRENPIAQYYSGQAEALATPEMSADIIEEIQAGNYSKAGKALWHQFVANAPTQAAIIGGTLGGAGVPALVGMGATQAADVNARDQAAGLDPADATANALLQGTAEAAFERLGTFGIMKHWEGIIAKNFGKKVSGEVMRDLGKSLAFSVASEANEEAMTSIAQDFSDYVTGANPDALTGMLQRAGNAAIVGGFSGGAMTAPGGIAAGRMRVQQEKRAIMARDFYNALGKTTEATELRQRLPEAQRQFVEKLTKDSPVETLYISPEALETYFQGQGINPVAAMQELGVVKEYTEAKEAGTDVAIATAAWVTKVVGTPHYEALANDVKFGPAELSTNEAARLKEELASLDEKAKDGAPLSEPVEGDTQSEDPAVKVRTEVQTQLESAGFRPEVAQRYAELWESRYRTRSALLGQDAMELFRSEGVQIQREGMEVPVAPAYDPMDSLINRIRDEDVPDASAGRGQSILEFVRERGGIKDDGGDLSAMEVDAERAPFRKNVIQESGRALDEMAVQAAESGYIAEASTQALLDAIDSELRGTPVYSPMNEDQAVTDQVEELSRLRSEIQSLGLDLSTMDNAEVKRRLGENDRVRADVGFEQTLYQRSKFLLEKIEGTENVLDARSLFESKRFADGMPAAREAVKRDQLLARLERFKARFGNNEKVLAAINKAQSEKKGPYVPGRFGGIPWAPNYSSEPTGFIGEGTIQDLSGKNIDPFIWAELKYGATKALIEKHAAQDKHLHINTSSDLIAHEDYLSVLPEGTTINFYLLTGDEGINRLLFPANPSRKRQENAIAALRERGFEVHAIESTGEEIVEAAGGIKKVRKILGINDNRVVIETLEGAKGPDAIIKDLRSNPRALTRQEIATIDSRLNSLNARVDEIADDDPQLDILQAELEEIQHILKTSESVARRREAGLGIVRDDGVEYFQTIRGSYNPVTRIIKIMQSGDLSTFLHESAHHFLEEIRRDIETLKSREPEALTPAQQAFLARESDLLKFLGVESLDKIEREHHERFAETFERYLHTGEAPSQGLREAFRAFRSWLIEVFRRIGGMPGQPITPEIKALFDRLIATEEQIIEAQATQNIQAWPGAPETVQKAEAEAVQAAEEILGAKLMATERKKKEKAYQEERQRVRAEIAAEVHSRPVYIALANLQRGKAPDGTVLPEGEAFKLSKDAIVREYGKERLSKLPRPYVYSRTGGMHPDFAAERFGFSSADEMLHALATAPHQEQLIESLTDEQMRAKHGDLLTDGQLPVEAMNSLHNEKRSQLLRKRLEWLASEKLPAMKGRIRAIFRGLPPDQVLRAQAQSTIAGKRGRDTNPVIYQRAEAKAAKEALDAYLKGDFQAAYDAQRRELLNHELYRAAVEAREQMQKDYEYMRGLEKASVRERLGKAGADYLEQIDDLLDRYEFRQVSNRDLSRRESLLEFASRMDARDIPHGIPDSAIEDARQINYRDLTNEERRGVVDAAKAIQHLAYTKHNLLLAKEARDREEVIASVTSSIVAHAKVPTKERSATIERILEHGDDAKVVFLNVETMVRDLDGGTNLGLVYEHIKRPIDRAVLDVLQPMQDKMADEVQAIVSSHYTAKELRQFNKRIHIPEIGGSLTKQQILAVAWNQGSESNRAAILQSEGLFGVRKGRPTEAQISAILSYLDKRDWDFVQAVWDYNDTYFGQLSEAHRRRTGLKLQKVEPIPVETRFGTYRGGYMTLAYDPKKSARAIEHLQDAYSDLRSGRLGTAKVRGRMMESRVGSGGQAVRLDFDVWHQHLRDVAYNLSMADAVNYVSRVLGSKRVRQAFTDTDNLAVLRSLDLWLKDVAGGEIFAKDFLSRLGRHLRVGYTISRIGLSFRTAALQFTGVFQSAVVIGKRNAALGFMDLLTGPWRGQNSIANQVYKLSPSMARRADTFQRDVADAKKAMASYPIPEVVKSATFYLMVKTQHLVDLGTYLGAYRKGMAEFGDEAKSAEYAERAVTIAQGSGIFSDRSAVERGTLSQNVRQAEFVRLFTALSSYMVTKANRAYERTKQANFKNPAEWLDYAVDMALLYMIEGICLALFLGDGPDEEEDESWVGYAFKTMLKEAGGSLPIFREAASAIEGFPAGGVIGSTAASLGRAYKQIDQGEYDLQLMKALNDLGGIFLKYPSTQMNRVLDAWWRESEGDEVAASEYLLGKPRR